MDGQLEQPAYATDEWVFPRMGPSRNGSHVHYDIDMWIVFEELDAESYVDELAWPCKSSIDMTSCGHYRRTILSA